MTQRSSSHLLCRLSRLLSLLSGALFVFLAFTATTALAIERIRSASELDYPPFALVTKDKQADGFAVEMLRESLRAMGREVSFEVGPWHKIKQDLSEGRIQVLPLVARTAERQAYLDFTAPYLSLHGTIVVRKGDSRIRRAEDLQGKVIVVMKGDSSEEYVRKHLLSDKTLTTLNSGGSAAPARCWATRRDGRPNPRRRAPDPEPRPLQSRNGRPAPCPVSRLLFCGAQGR